MIFAQLAVIKCINQNVALGNGQTVFVRRIAMNHLRLQCMDDVALEPSIGHRRLSSTIETACDFAAGHASFGYIVPSRPGCHAAVAAGPR